jgi:hypothetical protein
MIWQSLRSCYGVRQRDALASIIVKRFRASFSPVAVGTAIVVPSRLGYRADALPAKVAFTVIADVANHLAPVFIGRCKKNAVTTFLRYRPIHALSGLSHQIGNRRIP